MLSPVTNLPLTFTFKFQLFEASRNGNVETMKQLLENSADASQLVLQVDEWQESALHGALNTEVAQLLVDSVDANDLPKFLCLSNYLGNTALHVASGLNIPTIAKYLCGLKPELLLLKDQDDGNTPLHLAFAKETLQAMIESIPECSKKDYMFIKNKYGQTPLHVLTDRNHFDNPPFTDSSNVQPSAVEYYLNVAPDLEELLLEKDCAGRTALHYAETEETVTLLVDAAEDQMSYINMADNEGLTALMVMAIDANATTLQSTLEYMEDLGLDLVSSLLKTNNKGQNIFHVSSMSPVVDKLITVLQDYIEDVGVENILVPDVFSNTPLTYLVGRYSTSAFAEFMMKTPFWKRRELLSKKNINGVTSRSVSEKGVFVEEYYLKEILCTENKFFGGFAVESYTLKYRSMSPVAWTFGSDSKYNADIFRIMKYSLNEYSPLDLQVAKYSQVDDSSLVISSSQTEQVS